jgi:hypothetical protein
LPKVKIFILVNTTQKEGLKKGPGQDTYYYIQIILAPNAGEAEGLYREFLSRAEVMGLAKLEAHWTQRYNQAGGSPESDYVK